MSNQTSKTLHQPPRRSTAKRHTAELCVWLKYSSERKKSTNKENESNRDTLGGNRQTRNTFILTLKKTSRTHFDGALEAEEGLPMDQVAPRGLGRWKEGERERQEKKNFVNMNIKQHAGPKASGGLFVSRTLRIWQPARTVWIERRGSSRELKRYGAHGQKKVAAVQRAIYIGPTGQRGTGKRQRKHRINDEINTPLLNAANLWWDRF